MLGRDVLELVYDILAQNEVSQADRDRVTEALDYVDYDHHKIVIGGNELRIYDHEDERTDADKLTAKLIEAGADRAKVIAIVDGYGDPVDWNYHSLDSIVAEVWQSDLNSGDEPDGWIINEICRQFNIDEVTE